MTWTLSELAAIAEILGLVAIVPSLIFVGVQLARANREARAATLQAAMFSEISYSFRFADHASVWDKVITGSPLSEGEELRRGVLLYNAFMTDTENRYHQFRGGYLDSQAWEARYSTLPEIVSLPIFEPWRNSPGGRNHSTGFLEMLDELASKTREQSSNEPSTAR